MLATLRDLSWQSAGQHNPAFPSLPIFKMILAP